MSKITKKLAKSDLNSFELSELKNVLDKFEIYTIINTGMKHLKGGFAEAEMFNYDDEYIKIELCYGDEEIKHIENCKLKRSVLRSKKTIKEKLNEIETT